MNKQIYVLGAGVMGSGVAQLFAQNAYQVTLIDISEQQLEIAQEKIARLLRYQTIIHKTNSVTNKTTQEILSKISYTTEYDSLSQANFIVENITEKWSYKEKLYNKLNQLCPSDCIVGVNTSAISITKIASLMTNPERIVGIHFMNPVPLIPMVEMIRGHHTSEATIDQAKDLLTSVGRKSIVVNDSVGFVTNRAMMIFVNEAIFMLQENVATAEDIDTLFRQCFGHKMGPLQTADLIGLDTILYSLDVLYEDFNDPKYRPCWLLKKMVAAGLHGEKSKQGFYSYQ